jgi:nucleoside-diphosphate-sugar epimerase
VRLLIIGGTWFLGRHITESAIRRGHEVTLFNRGRHNADLFPDVEKLHGDRDGGLDVLRGRTWDAVIDTCGYVPRIVRASAELLRNAVEHYTFTSSMSVYADVSSKGLDETTPVGKLEDETVEQVTNETYGPLKGLCEEFVEEVFPSCCSFVRAGLIVGPYDYIDRFTYWVRRIARGGDVLAPGDSDRQIQMVDARDLADWIVRITEDRVSGTFNATGPDYRLTMSRFLEECVSSTHSDARLRWVSDQFLMDQQVGPFNELPLWLPEQYVPKFGGFMAFDCGKALAAGLKFRPLADTIRDTGEWLRSNPDQTTLVEEFGIRGLNSAITLEREAELLSLWSEHKTQPFS